VRSYGEYCSVAKALDVVGDRWALLIIRELLIRGSCRYTDLKNGLPGIATNLLSDRIRELETAGLIQREDAPPPVATTLYHLTDAGGQLEPVVRALGEWGIRFMANRSAGDEFRSQWFTFPVSLFLHDSDPDAPPVNIELRTSGDPAVIEVSNGEVRTRLGTCAAPDLVLTGEPQLILALLSGKHGIAEVTAHGLKITGDKSVLLRVIPQTQQPEPARGEGRERPPRSTKRTRRASAGDHL
jgi:DNA-binding HxlR family transcriptional regulator